MAKDEDKRHSIASFLKGGLFKGKKGKSKANDQAAPKSQPTVFTPNTHQAAVDSQSRESPQILPTRDDETERAQTVDESAVKELEEDREDQYGLKPLGPTEESNLDSTAPDIVAVHGIDGNAWETWKHKNGTFWLRDLLPKHVPGARIYSFGYQAAVAFTRGRGDVKSFARSLLEGLNAVRYNEVF